jgi:hypothetical protein
MKPEVPVTVIALDVGGAGLLVPPPQAARKASPPSRVHKAKRKCRLFIVEVLLASSAPIHATPTIGSQRRGNSDEPEHG